MHEVILYISFILSISISFYFVYHLDFGPVGGASLMIIMAGIVERTITINEIKTVTDISNVMIISAFISMSGQNIISKFKDILIISLIATVCYTNFLIKFNGVGGSMGIAAFVTVAIYYIINKKLPNFVTIFKIS
ncbi:hypothetical protein [Calditerrivibrio nitroreducens]|uniref:Uncharacterized protein n=1 Tax=Calditerrivibrio nitroreducens (strain DSM 19672 / NBRC 101217 / Yu37-1) TaxID=768670 RepID=E4TEG4_CALNY|nr:hypothetical protein [Calditerrivibrio nitroreducens]ADR18290.1 hypothetical protein Calni_0377 [Calditerrivibrio nitroreducens DSM 19672]